MTAQVAASVTVPTAGGGYPVRIGSGLVDRLEADGFVARQCPARPHARSG